MYSDKLITEHIIFKNKCKVPNKDINRRLSTANFLNTNASTGTSGDSGPLVLHQGHINS